MKDENLLLYQLQFVKDLDKIRKDLAPLISVQEKFVQTFSKGKIKLMTLEEYAIGTPNYKNSFCYILERELKSLGSIVGSPAIKFGIYYGKIKSDQTVRYRFAKKFGNDLDSAFDEIKNSIYDLLKAAANDDYDSLVSNYLSWMFKGKILSTYYPEKHISC